jgi:ABC-type multidrug transport system ATPase subunit
LLEVERLSVAFGQSFCVGPVSFGADSGIVHVEGPNGSGKTTLLRAMAGELLPADGSVRLRGRDVHRVAAARRDVALVPSIPELPDFLSVREAYQFAASLRGAPDWDGEPVCEALGLPPALSLGAASAGQRRKAELVCGLAADPAVLLLDETFAHLDESSVATLHDWLLDWGGSRLVLLAHHGAPPVPVDGVLHVAGTDVAFTAGSQATQPLP